MMTKSVLAIALLISLNSAVQLVAVAQAQSAASTSAKSPPAADNSANPLSALSEPSAAEIQDVLKLPPEQRDRFADLMRRSGRQYDAMDLANARKGLDEAIALCPSSRGARLLSALTLQAQGDIENARKEATKCYELDKTNPYVLVLLADLTKSSGDYTKAIALYNEALGLKPNEVAARTVRHIISNLTAELDKRKRLEKPDSAADYFALATYNRTTKWKKDAFPLKVFIPPSTSVTSSLFSPEYNECLRAAFDDWQKRGTGIISFTFVTDPAKADIGCAWKEKAKNEVTTEGGYCELTITDNAYISRASMTMLLQPNHSAGEMKTLALHEVGHALGLDGHSPLPDDIMFGELKGAKTAMTISDRDVNTLAKLYSDDVKPDPRPRVSWDYIRPDADADPGVLNEQGLALMGNKEYKRALPYFEQAYKSENTPSFKLNLMNCINMIAVDDAKAHNFERAMAEFERALTLADEASSRAMVFRNEAHLLFLQNKPELAKAKLAAADKLDGGSHAGEAKVK